jgi:hypothetical protein
MFSIGKPSSGPPLSENTAISIRNLKKIYKSPWFSRKKAVTAIEELSLEIPKTGIFILLGSNGSVPFSVYFYNLVKYYTVLESRLFFLLLQASRTSLPAL